MGRRARLVAAARNATNPDEVMRSIANVYGEARGSALFPTIARASAAGLLNLPAKPQFANVAQEAMRGFLLLGDKQQTQAWTPLALIAAAETPLGELHPAGIAAIVQALRQAGEDHAARLFAIETAIAYGL